MDLLCSKFIFKFTNLQVGFGSICMYQKIRKNLERKKKSKFVIQWFSISSFIPSNKKVYFFLIRKIRFSYFINSLIILNFSLNIFFTLSIKLNIYFFFLNKSWDFSNRYIFYVEFLLYSEYYTFLENKRLKNFLGL